MRNYLLLYIKEIFYFGMPIFLDNFALTLFQVQPQYMY